MYVHLIANGFVQVFKCANCQLRQPATWRGKGMPRAFVGGRICLVGVCWRSALEAGSGEALIPERAPIMTMLADASKFVAKVLRLSLRKTCRTVMAFCVGDVALEGMTTLCHDRLMTWHV
jgi:hypothetical protein